MYQSMYQPINCYEYDNCCERIVGYCNDVIELMHKKKIILKTNQGDDKDSHGCKYTANAKLCNATCMHVDRC